MNLSPKILYPTYIILLITFNSCGVVDFFGGVYEDLTTYFNTYYNAKTMFNEALSEMSSQEAELFPPRTSSPIQQSQPSGKFVNVIEKCSKILQFSKNSSYVDDALLMIGQCYFYQREYPSAMRKFTELSTAFPNSSLYLSARMWMAKTQSRMNEYETALNSFQEVIKLAKEKEDEEILMECYLELMKMSLARDEKKKAIDYGNQFIEVSNDGEKSSQVMLQIGYLYNEMNETENAIKSFEAVDDYSPTYKTKYRASLELAKLKRQVRDYETSLDILDDLKSESIFEEFYDRIDLETANTLLAQNQIQKAMDIYYQLDTTFARNESGGLAQYEIAKYLEFQLKNVDSAKYFYERCAASNAPKEIVQIASKRSQHMTKRKNLWDSIDKINQEIMNLQKFPGDTLTVDSLKLTSDSTFIDSLKTEKKVNPIDSILSAIDSSRLNDSTYIAFIDSVKNEKHKEDSIYIAKLKQDTITYFNNLKIADSLKVVVAKFRYDLGSLFFADMSLPDSALQHFEYVTTFFPNEEFTIRAMYSLANYYDLKGDTIKADSIFKEIYNRFNEGEIVDAVAKKLSLPLKVSLKEKPEDVFRQAEIRIQDSNYTSAIEMLKYLIGNHPYSDYAAKAYYTIGFIYENYIVNYDSAASYYDQLQSKFPATIYAQKSSPKLQAYQSEMKRIEQEKKEAEEKKILEERQREEEKRLQEEQKKSKTREELKKDIEKEKHEPLEEKIKTDSTFIPIDSLITPFDSSKIQVDTTKIKRD